MPRAYIRVQHIDRAEGGVVGTFFPLKPRFAFRQNDPGDITYELALSNPQIKRDAFAPKRTDFRLQVSSTGANWQNIMGGFHWPVSLENETGVVKIQGMDWMVYLEQPMWFDAYNTDTIDVIEMKDGVKKILKKAESWGRAWASEPGVDTDAVTFNATQEIVVRELIETIADGDNDTLKINLDFFGDSFGWGTPMGYTVMFQDSTNILDHIRAISEMESPFGFDFFMNWNKTLVCYNPALVSPLDEIVPIGNITRTEGGLVRLTWQNNGPVATHTLAVGAGSPGIWAHKTYKPSEQLYRRWLRIVRLGGAHRMPEQVLAAVKGIPDRFPQKELKITIKPEEFSPNDPALFFHPQIGRALYVDIDFPPYHRINANFWITAQEFSTDDAGNWLCDVSLQQIYDPSGIG
jgi:hypothetical protein